MSNTTCFGIYRNRRADPLREEKIRAAVFDHLNAADLTRAGAVCKSWRKTAQDRARIRDLYLHGAALEEPKANYWIQSYAEALLGPESERENKLDALMRQRFPTVYAQILADQTIAQIHPSKTANFTKLKGGVGVWLETWEHIMFPPTVVPFQYRSDCWMGLMLLPVTVPLGCVIGAVVGAMSGKRRRAKRRALEDTLMGAQRYPDANRLVRDGSFDPAVVLAKVQRSSYELKYASDELRNDPTIVLAAVKEWGGALRYASDALRNDPIIVWAAVQQWGGALEYASDSLKKDPYIQVAVAAALGREAAIEGKRIKALENEPFRDPARLLTARSRQQRRR